MLVVVRAVAAEMYVAPIVKRQMYGHPIVAENVRRAHSKQMYGDPIVAENVRRAHSKQMYGDPIVAVAGNMCGRVCTERRIRMPFPPPISISFPT